MNASWTSHLSEDKDKESFKSMVLNSTTLLGRLEDILNGRLKKPVKSDYNNGAWPYLRADMDGYNRAMEEVLSLISLNETTHKGKN